MISLFEKAYTSYIKAFHQTCKKIETEYSQQYSAEILFFDSSWSKHIRNLSRFDLAVKDNDNLEFIEVSLNNLKTVKTEIELNKNLHVVVSPFVWNGVEITCSTFDPSCVSFSNWFLKWMDPEDKKEKDSFGLHGIIHSLSVEQSPEPDKSKLNVDFGSAPTDSLIELLNLLHLQGNEKLYLDSKWNDQ